ncbi:MAG: ABC transporter permease [Calditrichaceae bacterium]|nr:ABC transporter permease [Calditrichaceae bacterium]MBN2709831.1 ABC transporter permease [Calditrichaceae bacterium]RQV95405.1 MAG: ABC transporter permease [Calditrichota bacterium]
MFWNHLKITFRNLLKNKGYSSINILGLAVGIACCVIIMLYVQNELGYDQFYKNVDSIYRVFVKSSINGQESCNCKTAAPLANTLVRDFPEVNASTRIGFFGNHVLKYDDKVYRERHVYTADSNFYSVFSIPFIYGNPKTALSEPNSIVMTQSAAKKYFGDENPVGKILKADSQNLYKVTGVMEDFPSNASFTCDILLSMSTYAATNNDDWFNMSYTTFIVLQKGADPNILQNKLKSVVSNYVGPKVETALGISFTEFHNKGNQWDFYLQPLTSIYLYSERDYGIDPNTEWGDQDRSNIDYIYLFSAVAIFILILAIINFINLTTARSETRSKEVGIKKTLGSDKTKLIGQFISESVIVTMFSVLIAVFFIETSLPFFNQLAGKDIQFGLFSHLYTIPALILFAIIIGVLSGSYPAFYLSSFNPVHLFRFNVKKRIKKSTLRSVLVVIQFTVSIALIISAMIIKEQLHYIQNKNLGFNKEYIYVIKNFGVPENKLHVIKQELLGNPNILSLTNSSIMFYPGIPGDGYSYQKRQASNVISSQYLEVDYDFLKTYKIALLQGRYFSEEYISDTTAVVINEAMIRECGTDNPVGNELIQIGSNKSYKIIGVIDNFNYQSLHEEIKPLALFLSPVHQAASILAIRISSTNIKSTISFIDHTWKQITGGEEIYSSFIDQDLENLYQSDNKASAITTIFSGLAIFIACLGLFGLASFVTEQRKKEIGIRKVLGSTIFEVVVLLSRSFMIWVLLANLIAWPNAWFAINLWLQNFAYRIDLTIWPFLWSGFIALLIALLTVSWQAIRAARANPVKSLRYE